MWKEKISKVLAPVEGGEKAQKRKIENLVVFIIILIICILAINSIWGGAEKEEHQDLTETAGRKLAQEEVVKEESKDSMTANLEDILSRIERSGESEGFNYICTDE